MEEQPQQQQDSQQDQQLPTQQQQQQDGENVSAAAKDDGPQRPPPNHDHGILTTKDGTPLIRLRSKKSIMESRFKLTMRTWDDVWKSTAWAKFAPDKLKHTLQRSARAQPQGELKGDDAESTAAPPSIVPVPAIKVSAVKKSRFKVVPHVQIDDRPAAASSKKSQHKQHHHHSTPPPPPLSSSSGSSDTDSDRLPAGLPMIESNLNELTMVESELKKLEREHGAKMLNDDARPAAEKTADDGAVQAGDGRKQQQKPRDEKNAKDKATSKLSSRAAETHSKRLGWLKAFRRKSSAADGTSDAVAAVAAAQPAKPQPSTRPKQPANKTAARQQSSSSPRQQQKQRAAAARSRQQQQHHHYGRTAVATTVSFCVRES